MFRTTICGSVVEPRAVLLELAVDRARSARGDVLGHVDHVHEQPRALEMREELVPEADALARALDQPGNVGDGELAPVRRVDGAEHRARAS